jgi:adenosine deaminase
MISHPTPPLDLIEEMKQIRKIDLHRHLEGSLLPEAILTLAKKHHITLPANSIDELRPLVQVTEQDQTLLDFIKKFDVLALLFKNKKIIQDITCQVIQEAYEDHIYYLELRFAPTYMSGYWQLNYHDIIEGVLEGQELSKKDFPNILTRFIIIVNREAPLKTAKEMLRLGLTYRKNDIVGLDLAGDEQNYPPEIFQEVFQEAAQSNFFITIHAGEARGAEAVQTAVEKCRAVRIGHGVRIAGNSQIETLIRDKKIYLEVCPTSNVQTGAVRSWEKHPILHFLEEKIPLTINTDDPGVSGITLSHEYALLSDFYKIPVKTLQSLCLSSVQAAFLPEQEKEKLKKLFAE